MKQSSSTDPVPPSGNPQCLYCSRNHALEDCQALRRKSYRERIQFLASHMLCFGWLSNDHVSRFCPQRMTCKIANSTRKHPSILHTNFRERPTSDQVGVGTESRSDTEARSNMVNAGTNVDHADQTMERCRTSMAVLPVKVRARNGDKTVITYAFLDNGSSATFCTESLMEQLGVKGPKVKISLSTLEKKDSVVDSFLISDLVVSDLDENEHVSIPTLYTRPEIPVSQDDIPTQDDVDQWSHLQGVFIPLGNTEIDLLIASDVPGALEPLEIKHSEEGGPYASRTRIGWAVNGPLTSHHRGTQTTGFFVKVDHQLQQMVEDFYNRDFVESIIDDKAELSQD